MDQMATLEFAIGELHRRGRQPSTTRSWTPSAIASRGRSAPGWRAHAVEQPAPWAGLVTGKETVSFEDTMGAVDYDGHLGTYADEVAARSLAMWATPGVFTAVHATPFGELPGSVVVNFATIDALCHAWDLSASLGRPLEFPPESIPAVTAVVRATCTDAVRALGLIKDVAPIARDASDTDRLMAQAGRSRPTVRG